ncbi:MAG TPA: hypothetical protein VGO64_11405, partial [Candidatus Limnocylindrales bacterium]|nr:hypothetical protein [Candidatus Limnocylindrales bacterium]
PDAAALAAATRERRGLAVISGEIEAIVGLPELGGATTDEDQAGERARLEKELAEAQTHLAAARARLGNAAFTERAPAAVVEGARARERELAEQVQRLTARLDR